MERDLLARYYAQYARPAYIYVFSLCRHHETAEDIVSAGFERAFLLWNETCAPFLPWLLTVCRNLYIDQWRHRKLPEPPAEPPPTPETELFMQERNRGLYAAILQLPPRYREILVCHYFENLSVAACASLMNIRTGNAKTLLCRARARLKMILEESGYEA